jgi:hypothetical protein
MLVSRPNKELKGWQRVGVGSRDGVRMDQDKVSVISSGDRYRGPSHGNSGQGRGKMPRCGLPGLRAEEGGRRRREKAKSKQTKGPNMAANDPPICEESLDSFLGCWHRREFRNRGRLMNLPPQIRGCPSIRH